MARTLGIYAADITTANRIVGFHEFTKALDNLQKFQAVASPTELRAANEFVRRRDEFSVYVNLSRLNQTKPTTLVEFPRAADDNFQRRGLDWMTALARVEVQAVLAAFTSHNAPFAVLPPTPRDVDEYNEVLTDGMRTHLWAFQNDPMWAQVLSERTPTSRTLAYLRRLALMNSFANAVTSRIGPQLTKAQADEITSWQLRLATFVLTLKSRVGSSLK